MLKPLVQLLTFKSKSSLRAYLLFATFGFFAVMALNSATFKTAENATLATNASTDSVEKGRVLAGLYCQACHLFPEPTLLDKKTWEQGALPLMGPRLGVFKHRNVDYSKLIEEGSTPAGFYPAQPLLTETEWQHIIDYYVASAPPLLPLQARERPIEMGLSQFSVESPAATYAEPLTSLVKIIEGGGSRRLIVSDMTREQTDFYDGDLVPVDAVQIPGTIAHVELDGEEVLVCNMGSYAPNNEALGKAQYFRLNAASEMAVDPLSLFEHLRRPVQVSGADLNGDGLKDFLVSEYGHLIGGLTWMEGKSGGGFERHALSDLPGAIKSYLRDHDGDGQTDVWALFAQGQEGISIFTNQGGGKFRQEQVLRFPATYGSSYFELVDFNQDGHADVLYTCGDNADHTLVLKPYHGVYIYLNNGANQFRQAYFFPIHGCYKAMARDFDGDGDLDIAAISAFASYAYQPEEGFVYLKNAGGLDFRPYSLEEGKRGRWLTMDAGDIDGDGDADLVLGNFSMLSASRSAYDWKSGPQFLLLRNKYKQ